MKEKIILDLINHIKDFGYWTDCAICFDDKICCDFDASDSNESFFYETDYEETDTIKLIKEEDDICYCTINKNKPYKKDYLKIILFERMGGLLYSDDCAPDLEDISPEAQDFMYDHMDMYTIPNHYIADSRLALFALEKFLLTHDLIIVDWDSIAEGVEKIVIAKKSDETLELRKKHYDRFKKVIKFEF